MKAIRRINRQEFKKQTKELNKLNKRLGLSRPATMTIPNRKSKYKTIEEEQTAVQHLSESVLNVYNQLLPGLLSELEQIPDFRNPNQVTHQMVVMMLYGILMFALQIESRREANQVLTLPKILEKLQAVFPYLADMPHQSSLSRLLEVIDVDQIEANYIKMLKRLIKNKVFKKIINDRRYIIAVDGTQKYEMEKCWDERYLCRKVKGEDGEYRYYAYVLEAVLIFSNGMVLPLMSEFLENSPELERIEDDETWKQDCELTAFYRLAKRLKKAFPKLAITLLLDGLYANGPVFDVCRMNKWEYMIVFKKGSIPSLYKEAEALMGIDKGEDCCLSQIWGGRIQTFNWVNDIEYEYGIGKHKKIIKVHVVKCSETWEEIDSDGKIVTKSARHVWISSQNIKKSNVHKLCNLMARKRWLHENNILKEKRQGYQYEHIFSYNWNAMKGYHFLMHIGRALNEFVLHSINLTEQVKELGFRRFIHKFRQVISETELDIWRLTQIRQKTSQLRLVHEDDWKINRSAA